MNLEMRLRIDTLPIQRDRKLELFNHAIEQLNVMISGVPDVILSPILLNEHEQVFFQYCVDHVKATLQDRLNGLFGDGNTIIDHGIHVSFKYEHEVLNYIKYLRLLADDLRSKDKIEEASKIMKVIATVTVQYMQGDWKRL